MGLNDKPSLQAAKFAIYDKLCHRHGFMCNSKLVRTDSIELDFRLVMSIYGSSFSTAHQVSLKYESPDKRRHFFKPKLDGCFLWEAKPEDDGAWHMLYLPRKWSSEIFDQICALSDAGNSIILSIYEPKTKKKDTFVLMQPYEGSKWQIEADLKAPDFSSLDWRDNIKLPF